MLSKISQKDKYCMILHVLGVKTKKTNRLEIETRFVVAKRRGVGEGWGLGWGRVGPGGQGGGCTNKSPAASPLEASRESSLA